MGRRVAHNKLSWEQVLSEFKQVHGDSFDYSNSEYVDNITPIEVYCKKHDYTFYPTPKNHRRGSKCKHCGRESQIEKASKSLYKFIQDSKDIYGNKDDYSLVNYKNNKVEVIISCNIHGEFKVRPDLYLQGKGCDKCGKKKTKSNDKEIFIEEAKKVYGDKDDYSKTKVISSKHKVEVRCKKHDFTFTKDIQTYLGGWGCPKCSAENYRELRAISKEEYYRRVDEVHEGKYTYNNDYTVLKNTVTFFCKIHGRQVRNANNLLLGYGCKECITEPIKINKISKDGYCKLANGRKTKLYFIKCFNEEEIFYKIGKTFNEIHKRFTNTSMPYNYEVMLEHVGSAENIWDLEEKLHKKYKEYSHKPKIWFAGYTECYNINLPLEEIWTTL